jgi:uncharacterized Zn-binding protein involved in type VI secretion
MGTPILHMGATVLCMHGGQATPTAPNPRVKVSGQPVVVQTTTYTIAGCPFTTASPQPCVTGQYVTAAVRVRVGGVPALLSTSTAICAPNGTGLNAVVTQMRVLAT